MTGTNDAENFRPRNEVFHPESKYTQGQDERPEYLKWYDRHKVEDENNCPYQSLPKDYDSVKFDDFRLNPANAKRYQGNIGGLSDNFQLTEEQRRLLKKKRKFRALRSQRWTAASPQREYYDRHRKR